MKIRIDENISPRIARAILEIVSERSGVDVSHNAAVNQGASDVDWLSRFAADGGDVIISGDAKILQRKPELVAYTESGLISFFPPSAFGQMRWNTRAAMILLWWPAIVEKAKVSQPGNRWRIPASWHTPAVDRFQALDDPRVVDGSFQQ